MVGPSGKELLRIQRKPHDMPYNDVLRKFDMVWCVLKASLPLGVIQWLPRRVDLGWVLSLDALWSSLVGFFLVLFCSHGGCTVTFSQMHILKSYLNTYRKLQLLKQAGAVKTIATSCKLCV